MIGYCIKLMVLALAVLAAESASADTLDDISASGTMTVGVKVDYGPWGHYRPDGTIDGFEPDLARLIATDLGVNLRLVPVTSANRLARLAQGDVDLVVATMGDTEERRHVARLITPHYYASGVRLLMPYGAALDKWSHLQGRSVCLVKGAYQNRHLIETWMVTPVVFPSLTDAGAALRQGRCVGLAYDDTLLAQIAGTRDWSGYKISLPPEFATSWAMAVRLPDKRLARRIEDLLAGWHSDGTLLDLENKWLGDTSNFLEDQNAIWSQTAKGKRICVRGPDGDFPEACMTSRVIRTGQSFAAPEWMAKLTGATGIDPAFLLDPFNRGRIKAALGNTLLIVGLSLAGASVIGIGAARLISRSSGGNRQARITARIVGSGLALAQLTPPILQLYILFFGLAAWIQASTGYQVWTLAIAASVFSAYAGATISALVVNAYRAAPDAGFREAIATAFDGIVATLVNIAKATGIASAIAYLDTITVAGDLIAEGADKATVMNLLLVFYLVLVMAVMGVLNLLKARLL